MRKLQLAATLVVVTFLGSAQAQTTNSATTANVFHTTKAVHYRPQGGGSVKTEFQGSSVMPSATGEAKVEGKKNNIEVDAKFQGLEDSTKFGL